MVLYLPKLVKVNDDYEKQMQLTNPQIVSNIVKTVQNWTTPM